MRTDIFKDQIYIITPCSRPENLKRMISAALTDIWVVVYDSEKVEDYMSGGDINLAIKGGVSGNLQRNYALDFLTGFPGWVYFLDDDTILHQDMISEVRKHMSIDKGKYLGYLFNQDLCGNRVRVVDPKNVKVRKIDQGQYLIHTDLIKDNRFKQIYEADGMMIEMLYAKNCKEFKIIPKVLCHYNYLRR